MQMLSQIAGPAKALKSLDLKAATTHRRANRCPLVKIAVRYRTPNSLQNNAPLRIWRLCIVQA